MSDLESIIHKTQNGIAKALRAGMKPNEVWLGADEMAVIEKYNRFKVKEISDLMGPPTLCGLKIRESHLPGVRVGASWDGED